MSDLDIDINRRYSDMLKRCNVRMDEDDEDEEEETLELSMGDVNIFDYKPEMVGHGVKFERIRRCTGYLSGDYKSRFNNAKRAEVEDRMNSRRRVESYHEIS